MTKYLKDEIISSTKIMRNFGEVLNKLKNRDLNKIAVIRNNEIEAVILPVTEYEKLLKRETSL
ncbi:MAG TPA: prevent-host-death protein [Spirochaetota bacterium]|jgi:PHD/YefM family antitoxin component YafN of YafNO toxin-antitoxin module|nr:prevent-host-death protein [Spirochaetota bacterium]